jgi:carboxyl-terminal processing protease
MTNRFIVRLLAVVQILVLGLTFGQAQSSTTNTPGTNAPSTNAADLFVSKGPKPVKLVPGPDDATISRLTSRILSRSHYTRKPFDAATSSQFLDQYLDSLDPSRLIFLQSDVADFELYRNSLDVFTLKEGDTTPAYVIFKRMLKRFDQQVEFINEKLKFAKMDFAGNDHYQFSRKDAPRPRDIDEARQLWWERLRYEYLQEKLNNQKPEEIVKVIERRYARIQRFLKEYDSDDVLQLYLTSLAQVYDPHSDYMGRSTLENFNISMKLSLFGIGALLSSEDGYCKVKELIPGGPAANSKRVKLDDRIIAVAQGDQEPVDVVDMKLNKVVELIRGAKGTKVRLTIIPADAPDPSTRKTVLLVRDEIKLEEKEAKAKVIEMGGSTNSVRLGVIDLPSFYADMPGNGKAESTKSTTADVARLIKKLKQENVKGIVLDLRHNGGGLLEEAITLTGLFIKKGPIVQVRDSNGTISVQDDPDPSVLYEGPLIILTSRFSASASEILAAALQDYGRAIIVGDQSTHGKGSVQQLLQLGMILQQFGMTTTQNPGALKITIRKFYRINGASTQLKGVTPDIILPSINNVADIVEGTLPNAMPWDTIPGVTFDKLNLVKPWLAELTKRSNERVATNADFNYVKVDSEQFKKLQAEKSVSMNEEIRRKEKDEAKARVEARKKEMKARPVSTAAVYEVTLKLVDQPGLVPFVPKTNDVELVKAPVKSSDSTDPEAADEEEVPVVDYTLNETENILYDLIRLSSDVHYAKE